MLIPIIPIEEEDLYLLWEAKHQAAILQKKEKKKRKHFTVGPGNPVWRWIDYALGLNGEKEVLLLSENSNLGFPGAANAGATLSSIFNRSQWICLVYSLMSQLFSLFTLLKEY